MKQLTGVFLLWLIGAAAAAFGAPLRVLIVTGASDLPYHDWRETTPFLQQMLEKTGRFKVEVLTEPRRITPDLLNGYDAILLNYNGPRWGEVPEKAVEKFIRSGKGMFAFHGASYGEFFGMVFQKGWKAPPDGNPGWVAYSRMLGVTWKPENIGHSVRHVYTVKWVDRDHPICRGLAPTFQADDELYHRMDLAKNAHVIATAYSDPAKRGTGKDEPQIWTVRFGKGRVVYTTLGHDIKALSLPGVLAAFAHSIEWVASGEVTLPADISAP